MAEALNRRYGKLERQANRVRTRFAMNNREIAGVFEDIADLLELKGENVFKIRAYQRAARTIEQSPLEMDQLVKDGGLKGIPGIGVAITAKISELVTTGKLDYYEKLRAEFPPGISALLDIPGIGPRTAMLLSTDLGVASAEDLEKAILEGRMAGLPRMGEKTAGNILRHIQALRRKDQRIPIGVAVNSVEAILTRLRDVPGVRNLVPAGSLRRFLETVGDIDLMGTADDPQAVIKEFTSLPAVKEVLGAGPTKGSVVLSSGIQVDLRIVDHDSFGSLLQHFTGSRQHNVNLRTRAVRQGLSLSEYGITDGGTGRLEKFATEEAFYERLGLQYIPPEVREGTDEIERAAAGTIPRLVEPEDIRGDLHVHTSWSDGRDSIESMVDAAELLGYEYICISDHSAGRGIARGLNKERLEQQTAEIESLRGQNRRIRVLTGMEVDIRADGDLDMPDAVLERLDVVTGSIHSAMDQPQERMTARIIRAMENPNLDVLGHPTGRLMPERGPVAVDMEAVFQTALRYRDRDRDQCHARQARSQRYTRLPRQARLGVPLVINTDSHSAEHLSFRRFGAGVARRGWCEAKHILTRVP